MSEIFESHSILKEINNKINSADDTCYYRPFEEATPPQELSPYDQIQEVVKYIENLRGKTDFEQKYEEKMGLNVEFQCLKSISSADNGKIFAFGAEKSIKVFDSFTEKEIFSLSCSSKFITSISMTPDGFLLTYGSEEKFIKIYDLKTQQQIAKLQGHTNSVKSVCFSTDGKKLASGSCDNSIKIWDLAKMREEFTLKEHFKPINCLCFDNTAMLLASGADDGKVVLWNINDKAKIFSFDGHYDSVNCVCFNENSDLLASGSVDNSLIVWNLKDFSKKIWIKEHKGSVNSLIFLKHPMINEFLISASDDKIIKSWNVENWTLIKNNYISEEAHSICKIKSDIAILGKNSKISILPLKLKQDFTLSGHSESVVSVCFSPDGNFVASGSADGTIKLWNLQEQKEIFTLSGHLGRVESVCFSPDGKLVASGSADKTIKLWSLQKRKEIFTLLGHSGFVNSILFSSDGKFLKSMGSETKYWNLEKRKEIDFFDQNLIDTNLNELYSIEISNNLILLSKKYHVFHDVYSLSLTLSSNIDASYPTANLYSIDLDLTKNSQEYYDALYCVMHEDYSSLTAKSWQVSLTNFNYSPLHLAAFKGETSIIESAIKNDLIKLTSDAFRKSPLFYSISGKHQTITDSILNFLISLKDQTQLYFDNFDAVKYDLPLVIKNSSQHICEFLSNSIMSSDDPPQFGEAKIQFKFISTKITSFNEFIEYNSNIKEPLKLKSSAFDLPCTIGSKSSIELLNSFFSSTNKEIYKTTLIKTFIRCRWNALKKFIVLYTILLWLNILFLVLLLEDFVLYFLIPFIVLNSFLILWEITEIIQTKWSYFSNYWNIIDSFRIIFTIAWVLLNWFSMSIDELDWVTFLLNLTRGVSGFRAFDTTRYYIRLILQSLRSIGTFILVFIYTTLSFGILKAVIEKKLSFEVLWINSFGLGFGDSWSSENFDLDYITYLAAIVLNVLLMLNMIISILGDSFDEFQLFADYYDNKEMNQVILEIEQIFSIFVKDNLRKYLHICGNYYESNEESWQGIVIDLRNQVNELENRLYKKIEENQTKIYESIDKLNEKSDNIENKVALMDSKINILINLLNSNKK